MNFEKFTLERQPNKTPSPPNMVVGQVVVRKNIKRSYVGALNKMMRAAMRDQGMEFSHGWDGDDYAIRRDK